MILELLLAAIAPAPLEPSDKWVVAYEKSMCLASRKFGPAGEITLMLSPSPVSDGLEVTFIQTGSSDRRMTWAGKGKLAVGPGGQEVEATYKAWRSHEQGGRVVILQTKEALFELLSDNVTLNLVAPKEERISLVMRNFDKLKPVLTDCRRKVAAFWGVDLTVVDRVATRADPIDEERWITTNDYPSDALRKGQSGMTTMLWVVDENGRAIDCKPVVSSGVASLDRAACSAITKHASYKPALDKDGNPVRTYGSRRVFWIIPRG